MRTPKRPTQKPKAAPKVLPTAWPTATADFAICDTRTREPPRVQALAHNSDRAEAKGKSSKLQPLVVRKRECWWVTVLREIWHFAVRKMGRTTVGPREKPAAGIALGLRRVRARRLSLMNKTSRTVKIVLNDS